MNKIILMLTFITFSYAQNIYNALPNEKIDTNSSVLKLGEKLFFDPLLSKNNDISCFSCHYEYGSDLNKVSLGTNGEKGFVNAPSVFNSKFNLAQFWNGRAIDLKSQILGPILEAHEMALDKDIVETRLNSSKEYIELFNKSYNAAPSFELTLDAIVEYEKTLTTPNSKFDKYLRGETTLTPIEKKGLELFENLGCVVCHNGINMGGNSFQEFGSVVKYPFFKPKETDRYSVTKNEDDIGVYRVPSLRNVAKTSPYFHTGEIIDLKDAIIVMANYNLGKVIDDDQAEAIKSFLETLTGELPKSYKLNMEKRK